MSWAIVYNNEVKFGPASWRSSTFSRELSKLGFNVSVQTIEPKEPIISKAGWKILSVENSPVVPNEKILVSDSLVIENDVVKHEQVLRDKTEEELNPTPLPPTDDDLRQWALENKYLEATKALVELSGTVVKEGEWTKLEDIEFEDIAQKASKQDSATASVLLSTLLYTFFQLKLLGVSWENIEYHELPNN